MRILLDATNMHSRVGGHETYLLNLLNAWHLVEPTDEFVVVTTPDAPESFKEVGRERGKLETIGGENPASRFLLQQYQLRRAVHKYAPDVLFATTPVIPMLPTRVPSVAVVHDLRYVTNPEEFSRAQLLYRNFLYSYSYRHAKALIAISRATRDDLVRLEPRSAARTTIIYHGADHTDTWLIARKTDHHAVAFGHWSNKRPDLSVRVWAELGRLIPGFNWTLHVVGTAQETADELRALASDLGLGSTVVVHPFLAREDFQRLFTSASLMLFPSTAEGFGLPLVEAMQLGIPIVTSDIAPSREVASNVALFAPADSVQGFAQQCERVVRDHSLAATLSRRGIAQAARFSWQRCASETRQVLRQACESQALTSAAA